MADFCLNQHVEFIRNPVVGLFYRKPHVVQRFNQLLNHIVLHFLRLNVFFFLTCKIVMIHEFFVYFFDTPFQFFLHGTDLQFTLINPFLLNVQIRLQRVPQLEILKHSHAFGVQIFQRIFSHHCCKLLSKILF